MQESLTLDVDRLDEALKKAQAGYSALPGDSLQSMLAGLMVRSPFILAR